MDETPAKSNSHRTGWIVGGIVAGIVVLAVAAWFLAGQKIWTDGGSIRVADGDANLRQVVWARPVPLEGFASDEQVYEPSISPDGTELYFVRGKAGNAAHIYVSERRNNAWTKPAPVNAVNGTFDSLGPRLTHDGRFLLFYSNRPGGLGGYDIWAAPRSDAGWGKPFNLGPSVNSEFNEFNPDPTPDGKHLVFATNRADAKRQQNEAWRSTIRETVSSNYDLWIADADYRAPAILLPTTAPATQPVEQPPTLAFRSAREIPGINTSFSEGASCMSPAGDFLYFASDRAGGRGKFDIYRSRVHGDEFGPVENLGPAINTSENESDPALAYNGFRLIFSSDRPGADGRYRLLASDSREVYPERQAHPLPALGWSWWLLIGSIVILVPLLMFLRGWDDRRLGILQKCLLLSLLFHALITFVLSFVVVTEKITQYVKQETRMEIPVQLKQDQGLDETLAIRSQMSGHVPVSDAPAASLQPARVQAESVAEPLTRQMDVPGVRVAPGGMTIPVQAIQPRALSAPSPQVQAQAAASNADLIDVKVPTIHTVSQAETAPKADTPLINLAAAAPASIVLPNAAEVRSATVPSATPAVSPLANIESSPHQELPSASDVHPVTASTGVLASDNPVVEGPHLATSKVAASEATAQPSVQAAAASVARNIDANNLAAPPGQSFSMAIPRALEQPSTMDAGTIPAGRAGPKITGDRSLEPRSPQVTDSIGQPDIHIAVNNRAARQNSPEPVPQTASVAEAARPSPSPGLQNGQPAAGPGQMNVSEMPVKSIPHPTDLSVALAGSAAHPAGRLGTEIGSGPAPAVDAAVTPVGAQVALPAGGLAKTQSAEPALAASRGAEGPTTRPIELATGSGSAEKIELGTMAGDPGPFARSTSQITIGVARSNAVSQKADVVPVSPDAKPVGSVALSTPKAGSKVSEISIAVAPSSTEVATIAVPGERLPPTSTDAKMIESGKLPATAAATGLRTSELEPSENPGTRAVAVASGPAASPTAFVSDMTGADVSGPKMTASDHVTGHVGAGPEKVIAANTVITMTGPAKTGPQTESPSGIDIGSGPILATAKLPRRAAKDSGPMQAELRRTEVASASVIIPDISLAPIDGSLGPGKLTAPDSPFMRSVEQRKPLLEKMGGTQQSEDAVAMGLAYLARMQEEDGRWTRVEGDRARGKHAKSHHDMACTGFALLAFLGQDNRPDKPGPYRDVVARAVDYLISQQDENGDLRGPRELRGGGSDSSNMYDQGVASYALAECGIMTHDPRVIDAAIKAAKFIVASQDPASGGWRYFPKESGDSSVFGWQIMALHSAEQIGFEIPADTLDGAKRYIKSCEEGKFHLLYGYQPHNAATPPMTAEILFSRMLLDLPLSVDGIQEVTTFLSSEPPDPRNADIYYWYYASLSMLNMQNPKWQEWNVRTRESLIQMQRKDGPSAGCWEKNMRWGDRGGRVFTTAMATLTLEVYYRYLPLRKNAANAEGASSN